MIGEADENDGVYKEGKRGKIHGYAVREVNCS